MVFYKAALKQYVVWINWISLVYVRKGMEEFNQEPLHNSEKEALMHDKGN